MTYAHQSKKNINYYSFSTKSHLVNKRFHKESKQNLNKKNNKYFYKLKKQQQQNQKNIQMKIIMKMF